ncbi:VCBS repeat-containing protein [Streptomyces sp. NPDC002490]|uniref:FG-GAP repeat domain-containing protein n=1 Tax=Streptomyces sp. NPDC002490 TaxID=3154416 RepID=UPI0033183D77
MPSMRSLASLRPVLAAATLGGLLLGGLAPAHAAPDRGPAAAAVTATASSVGGAISRTEILQRAQYWVDQRVPYSQTAYHRDPQGRTYRTDCSGLVSMAWHLPTSAVTSTLPNYSSKLAGLDNLQPGDALNDVSSHVMLFVGWTDGTRTSAKIIEHARPDTVARPMTYSRSYLVQKGFEPYRYNKVTDSPVTVPDKGMTHVTGVGDLTGDGISDVIAVQTSNGDLYRYSGPNYTGGTARTKIGHGWDSISDIVGTGDLTGDGVADVIAVDATSGDLYRYAGPGYAGGGRVKIGVNWDSMTNVTPVGDLTGDGQPDVIAVEKATGDLYRYAGPNFAGGAARTKIGNGWNVYSTIVGTGDLTGDGVADIVAIHATNGNLYRYSGPHYNGGTRVQIGNGWQTMTNLTGVGDITGDNVPDLLAVNAASQKLYRYSGPGFAGSSAVQIGVKW